MALDDDIPFIDRERLRWVHDEHSLLGEGSFGVVYKGTWDGTEVAIKVVKRPENANASDDYRIKEVAAFRQHRREIHRFQAVQNPHIIQYFNVFRDADPRDLYIVTEYLTGGSLYESLSEMRARDAVLHEQSFITIARHIANGLNHVHSEHYTHGDMKPQNVLLTSAFQFEQRPDGREQALFPPYAKVKIADFGLSKRLEGAKHPPINPSIIATTEFGTGPCGTFLYMAPEVYDGVSELPDADVKAADIFAYGMVLFELLSSLPCWGIERVRHVMHLQSLVKYERKRPAWGPLKPFIKPAYIQLVERCWSHATSDRPTMREIIQTLQDFQTKFSNEAQEPTTTSPAESSDTLQLVEDPDDVPIIGNNEPLSSANSLDEHSSPSNAPESDDVNEQATNFSDLAAGELIHVESMRPITEYQSESAKVPDLQNLSIHDQNGNEGSSSHDSLTANVIPPAHEGTQNHVGKLHGNDGHNLNNDDATKTERSQVVGVKPDVAKLSQIEAKPEDANNIPENEQARSQQGSSSVTNQQNEYGGQKFASNVIDGWELPVAMEGTRDSIIDGMPFTRVQSTRVLRPSEEQLVLPEVGQGVHGLGSIADNENHPIIPNRSKGAQLDSFCNAAHLNLASPVPYPQATSQNQEQIELSITSPQVAPATGPVPFDRPSDMANDHASNTPAFPETPLPNTTNNAAYPHDPLSSFAHLDEEALQADLHQLNEASFNPDLASTAQRQDVMIPDAAYPVFTEMPQPINQSNFVDTDDSSVRPVVSRPPELSSTYARKTFKSAQVSSRQNSQQLNAFHSISAVGATAPPLSNTEQSVPHGSPSEPLPSHGMPGVAPVLWQSPVSTFKNPDIFSLSGMNQNPVPVPQTTSSLVDVKEVLQALRNVNGIATLENLWLSGHSVVVAASLAQADWLNGEDFLQVACKYLQQNNNATDRPNAVIAKDLCIAIGKISRNDTKPIGQSVILYALPISLSSMFKFQGNVEVFVATNFALCNLLKVNNTIFDYNLRTELAAWINYSISWNVHHESMQKGPHLGSLAYEAASAARNFMWLNDANVEAFVAQQNNTGKPATTGLMMSIEYFQVRGDAVVDASLSALAMIVRVPAQRRAFIRQHGKRPLHDVQQRNSHRVAVATLIQSMVTLLDAEQALVWQT